MATAVIMTTCSNPGCDQPGTNKCSACKTTFYCSTICQTADWAHHKEECPGHLLKVGMANLEKARGFGEEKNFPKSLHHANLAATKLKQLKDRPVEDISQALRCKFNALSMMDRHREGLECAKEWYCLWLTKHTHPPAILAGFAVIESCIHNKEFFDAVLYARTTWETLTLSRDSHIPDNQRDWFIAQGAHFLAKAIKSFAQYGDMPAEEQKKAGVEAIMRSRRALEIDTQLYGAESIKIAEDMTLIAQILDFFDHVDNDEVLRLNEQSKAIFARVQGSLSTNVAAVETNLAAVHRNRANRAYAAHDLDRCVANFELALPHAAHDLDRCVVNFELALPHFREAARIYRAINLMGMAD